MAASEGGQTGLGLGFYEGPLASYRGRGTLSNHKCGLACDFAAGQLRNGSVVLLCKFDPPLHGLRFLIEDPPDVLKGHTCDGASVKASGDVQSRNWITEEGRRSTTSVFPFSARNLVVRRPAPARPSETSYLITNFAFSGSFPISIQEAGLDLTLRVSAVSDVEERLQRLRALRRTDVTAQVDIASATDCPSVVIDTVLDDFCHVASIGLGTHVQWISRKQIDPTTGEEVMTHAGRRTRGYCGMSAIDTVAYDDMLPDFISSCLPTYRKRRDRWQLDRGTVAAYLDAKAEGDLLEQRAAKLSVAIEGMKDVFLASGEADVDECVVDPNEFTKQIGALRSACRDVLKRAFPRESVEAICAASKFEGLNRRSFRYLLKKLMAHLGLHASEDDIARFIENRNCLVHRGQFAGEESRVEWYFMVNMLDRIYLKLLGYSGPYRNWTGANGPRREMLE